MQRGLLDKALLYIGCHCYYTFWVVTLLVWTFGLVSGAPTWGITLFWVLTLLFIYISRYYLIKIEPEIRKEFFERLDKKGVTSAKIDCANVKKYAIKKATGQKCPNFLKKAKVAMEYNVSFFYLCDNFLTIYTNCVKYHIYNIQVTKKKRLFIPKKIAKEDCGEILEYYYYYIQRVYFSDNKIIFVFMDGSKEDFPAAKGDAMKIIKDLRERLRHTANRKIIHGYPEPLDIKLESDMLDVKVHQDPPPEVKREEEEKKE